MEVTQVIIVGGGPAGLALGLSLARLGIHSVILEKEAEITTDPRGVFLTGDAVRILHSLGIGHEMSQIGHDMPHVNFHRSSFATKPILSIDFKDSNSLDHGLSEGVLQVQPKLEMALRKAIEKTEYCSLRISCKVVGRSDQDPLTVDYEDQRGSKQQICGSWLIGADGKLGIVRKHFLEPLVGIKQKDGLYPYSGTWIAANLKMTLPTPESHPELPLWKLGYSPEDVYDLFWPVGWHFCTPPGKATASGRFGPHADRLWRHEFCQEGSLEEDDSQGLLWEHITPMITLQGDTKRKLSFDGPVQYPRDCIEILRCRPFHFVHKVVDRWFHGRTILIGDAAHVFPPFAGQGIASGVRDAHQLAWRLALMLRPEARPEHNDKLLKAWERERRCSIDRAAHFSMLNGRICNHETPMWMRVCFQLLMFIRSVPALKFLDYMAQVERRGFSKVEDGFFLRRLRGGIRLPQVYMRSTDQEDVFLSDALLRKPTTIFTIIAISDSSKKNQLSIYKEVKTAVDATNVSCIIANEAIIIYDSQSKDLSHTVGTSKSQGDSHQNDFTVCLSSRDPAHQGRVVPGYNSSSLLERLGKSTKFVIIRPDFFIFSCDKDVSGLLKSLSLLRSYVGFVSSQ